MHGESFQPLTEAKGLTLWTHPVQNLRLAAAVEPLLTVEAKYIILDVLVFGVESYNAAIPTRKARLTRSRISDIGLLVTQPPKTGPSRM